jgi:hypothetical protein
MIYPAFLSPLCETRPHRAPQTTVSNDQRPIVIESGRLRSIRSRL